jgi:UPF0271 protein
MRMDLNCDMGELPEAVRDGTQEALMASVTSVNVACGGHAGDPDTMEATIRQALRHGVGVGAHPGYADRENFGRIEVPMTAEQIAATVHEQVELLASIAQRCGAAIGHVKPHGALYNLAARDAAVAGAIAEGVARWRRDVILVGLAGSSMLEAFARGGFRAAAEAFADRAYESDGRLRSRRRAGALIEEPRRAAAQALQIARHGGAVATDGRRIAIEAQTICIHGDTPGCVAIAAAVATALREAGIALEGLRR